MNFISDKIHDAKYTGISIARRKGLDYFLPAGYESDAEKVARARAQAQAKAQAQAQAAEAVNIAQAQAQAAENSAAAEIVPAPGADAEQAQAQPVYFYPPITVKPRFGLVHVFLLVGSIYLLKKIFKG